MYLGLKHEFSKNFDKRRMAETSDSITEEEFWDLLDETVEILNEIGVKTHVKSAKQAQVAKAMQQQTQSGRRTQQQADTQSPVERQGGTSGLERRQETPPGGDQPKPPTAPPGMELEPKEMELVPKEETPKPAPTPTAEPAPTGEEKPAEAAPAEMTPERKQKLQQGVLKVAAKDEAIKKQILQMIKQQLKSPGGGQQQAEPQQQEAQPQQGAQ